MVWLVDCRNVFVLDTHCVRNLLLGGFWSICYTVQLFFSKVLFEMKRQGVTPNAFTYGYYNQVRAALLWFGLNTGRLVLKKNPVFSAWASTLNMDLFNKG